MAVNFYNMDCLEGLKNTPDKHYDLAIVDPPYGIGADKAQNAGGEKWGYKKYKDTNWDEAIPPAEYWSELFRVSKDQIVWGGNYMTEFLPPSMGWIVWDKGQRGFSLADGELAWTSFNKAMRIFEMSRGKALAHNNQKGGRFHATQKPVQLYEWCLIKYAKQGFKILDTHGGSHSIAIACHNQKLDLDIYEIDRDFHLKGQQRYKEHIAQKTLF